MARSGLLVNCFVLFRYNTHSVDNSPLNDRNNEPSRSNPKRISHPRRDHQQRAKSSIKPPTSITLTTGSQRMHEGELMGTARFSFVEFDASWLLDRAAVIMTM